jgi:hypothetical protein
VKPGAAALAALLLPAQALACAVCGAANERRVAFLVTTILLSLLPLALIAAGLWWIAHHARGRLAGEFAEREPGVVGEPATAVGAVAPATGAGPLGATPGGGREG